jgi:tripartite-type tricarboxylate transporter receptor subunit TctC
MPMAKGGRVRILAITGKKRSAIVPEVPTFEELGVPGLTIDSWYALFAPASLAAATAARFNQASTKALSDPEIKQKIAELSIELAPSSLKEADDVLKQSTRV